MLVGGESLLRAVAARGNYLGQDRMDMQFAAKEVSRFASKLEAQGWSSAKRLPRYLKDRCCDNERHVSNLDDDNYGDLLEDAVLASRKNMKDFAFRQGLRNIRVLGPWSSLRKLGNNMWEIDQVHVNKEGFDAIAELVSTCASESWDGGRWL